MTTKRKVAGHLARIHSHRTREYKSQSSERCGLEAHGDGLFGLQSILTMKFELKIQIPRFSFFLGEKNEDLNTESAFSHEKYWIELNQVRILLQIRENPGQLPDKPRGRSEGKAG